MKATEHLADHVSMFMGVNGFSYRKMADELEVSVGFIQNLLKGNDTQISDEYYNKLAEFTNYKCPKTIVLDPMLDSRLNNIDYMILQREIELNILRKLQESKCK